MICEGIIGKLKQEDVISVAVCRKWRNHNKPVRISYIRVWTGSFWICNRRSQHSVVRRN